MTTHFDLSDRQFEEQFRNGTFDPDLFNHEAHLRLAWIHIKKYGIDTAIDNICDQLMVFVRQHGMEGKFNKTLTIAAIKAVDHFISRSNKTDFLHFLQQHPRLKYNFKDLMASHNGVDIYQSTMAKKEFVQPDLLPFDV